MSSIELVDCHTHTVFSDGASTLEENMEAALGAGITTIACTDHWGKPDFIDYSIKANELSRYLSSVAELRNKYPSLEIVSGLEADWYPGCEADLRTIRADFDGTKDYRPTFLLGSVHFLQEEPIDWDEQTKIWDELGTNALWCFYAKEWCAAATSGLFNSMAHPDLPRLLSTKGYVPTIDLAPLYKEMAEAARAGGVHVEINTAGLIKGFNDFYPRKALLSEFFAAGVPLTVGSDAHLHTRIGANIEDAYRYARSVGYTNIDAPTQYGTWRSISIESL